MEIRFQPLLFHVELFLVGKVALRQVVLLVPEFPLTVSFQRCTVLIFVSSTNKAV
jgi:hypothetical protein